MSKCIEYARKFKEQYLAKSMEFLITSMNWLTECPEDANAKYAFIIAQTASDLISKGEIERDMALRLSAMFQVAEIEQPGDKSLHEFYRNEAKNLIDTMQKAL